MTVLHSVCYSLVSLCINYGTKEQQYLREIDKILELDLPAITPKFNTSRVDPHLHGICKILVSTLARILLVGLNAFVNYKKTFSSSKGNEETVRQTKG